MPYGISQIFPCALRTHLPLLLRMTKGTHSAHRLIAYKKTKIACIDGFSCYKRIITESVSIRRAFPRFRNLLNLGSPQRSRLFHFDGISRILPALLFQPSEQTFLFIRFANHFPYAVSLRLNCLHNGVCAHFVIRNDLRSTIHIRRLYAIHAINSSQDIIEVSFAHTAVHSFNFYSNFQHISLLYILRRPLLHSIPHTQFAATNPLLCYISPTRKINLLSPANKITNRQRQIRNEHVNSAK